MDLQALLRAFLRDRGISPVRNSMKKVISVRFKENGKSYYFDPGDAVIHTGENMAMKIDHRMYYFLSDKGKTARSRKRGGGSLNGTDCRPLTPGRKPRRGQFFSLVRATSQHPITLIFCHFTRIIFVCQTSLRFSIFLNLYGQILQIFTIQKLTAIRANVII